jgi:photosystem II stability/assembly factor-like uncharacterized protein
MTRNTAIRLVTSAALITSAGCGRAVHPVPSAGSPVPSRTCQAVGAVTEADSGHTYCLARSAHLEVFLHGTAQDRWSPIKLDGNALRRLPNGKGMLALGVTGGFFIADHAGTAHLTSIQRPCGRSAPVGNCGPLRTLEITIIVR